MRVDVQIVTMWLICTCTVNLRSSVAHLHCGNQPLHGVKQWLYCSVHRIELKSLKCSISVKSVLYAVVMERLARALSDIKMYE